MATITIDNFGGIAPRVHPTLLSSNMAVRAHNCLLKSGKLVPIRQPAKIQEIPIRYENGIAQISDSRTLYLWHKADGTKEFLIWPGNVWVAESNLSQDVNSRIFISGDTGVNGNHPCVYIAKDNGGIDVHDMVKESLPPPVLGDIDSTTGQIVSHVPSDEVNEKYTAFFQSWVDEYGYESGLSNVSDEVVYTNKDTLVLDRCDAPELAVARRIYQVVSGTESENIQFIFEQKKIGNSSYFARTTVLLNDENAGEIVSTFMSPQEDLEMICKVPNGFYAGVLRSNKREVRFSEIGNPSQWPDAYTTSIFDDIVGLGITLNTVFVLTKGKPWAITGTAPESMTASVLASPQGCVSQKSICVYNGAIFYISEDGICMLQDSTDTVSVITDKMFSKREWQKFNLRAGKMVAYDNALYVWFDNAESLVINMQDESSVSITTHDEKSFGAICVDAIDDKMYFVR